MPTKTVTTKSPSPGASARGRGTSPIIQISPHVYVSSNDPDAAELKAAWQRYIAKHGGEPANALGEYNDWTHVCGQTPGLCRGEFGLDFSYSLANNRVVGVTSLFRLNVDFVVTSVKYGSILPVAIINASFAQKWYSENFSAKGRFKGQAVNDIADALRDGTLASQDVPINIIIRDGNTLILNTRSAQALTRAGIPRENWRVVDKTGVRKFERLLDGQLTRNGLDSSGYPDPDSGPPGDGPGGGEGGPGEP
jgi:hypothetical protein